MPLMGEAYNELLDADSNLEALYERMLSRLWLDNVQDKANFRFILVIHQDVSVNPLLASLRVSDE
ncbi:hypothetical protein [Salmonella enterica]|uniref:hypothetical protein n=1 Tax=Salmonella enterica TaxID=28901 RepID=UPI00398C328B